jgi:protein gp37
MGKETKIAWCHHTFNPWIGCSRVSPGCDHCYAEAMSSRSFKVEWGPGQPRRRTSPANWSEPLKWNDLAEGAFERPRVFCSSLADVFDNEVDASWLFDLITLIVKTPNLDWLLLTKRIGNFRSRLTAATQSAHCDPLDIADRIDAWITDQRTFHNIWLGATVVNQIEADRDIPKLIEAPANVRFLSIEPMLGPISLDAFLLELDWTIVGGESGPFARPMDLVWARDVRDQSAAANRPFFYKQSGGRDRDKGGDLLEGVEHKNFPIRHLRFR